MGTAQFDNKNNRTAAQIEHKLRDKYGANVTAVKSAFRAAYPDKPIANALYIDSRSTVRTLKTGNLKITNDEIFTFDIGGD